MFRNWWWEADFFLIVRPSINAMQCNAHQGGFSAKSQMWKLLNSHVVLFTVIMAEEEEKF